MGAGIELSGRRKDGSHFPAEISLSAITTEEGALVSAAVRDVTDRKRAEAKFRGLLEAAPDAIVGVDSEGCIALVNAQTETLFGYTRDELLGQPVEILVPEALRGVHPQRRSGYFRDPRPRPMGAGTQLRGRRRDGTDFPAEISLSALETEEGLLVSAAVRDVTDRLEEQAERERLRAEAERERLDARLQQSQRLESLGQLAGGVAHDFNNLLSVILNYTLFVNESVSEAAAGSGGSRWGPVADDLQQVLRAAERAAELTHQLLAFGRRDVVDPRPVNLDQIVGSVEQLLQRTLGEHIDLQVHPGRGLWSVMADPGQMEQVLMNLTVNARDAMRSGGTLTIDTENTNVDQDFASTRPDVVIGRYVRVRVSDSGTGMEPEVMERAFEPFFTTKPKGQGTGLGLATVYGIVKQAGGTVQIYSEQDVGTTVQILLPATDQTAVSLAAKSSTASVGRGETVLVVEDEEALREVARRILVRNGHTVLTAANGTDALAMAETHQGEIHLLLTDVVMPQMLGKEVAERIHAIRPSIRVLYMSGYAQPVLASQGTLDAGVILLSKPFSETSLMTKIREVLT
jgi:hypothetical protein